MSSEYKSEYEKERKLMEQAEFYKQTFHLLARMTPGLLQKEVEEKDTSKSELCHMKNLLIKAILCQLKQNVRQHVEQECYGCRINHPSQKQHDMCLWTTPVEWIRDYDFHEPALRKLNIYEVMCEWSDLMYKYVFPDKPVEFEGTKGIDLLTPEESIEACKDWVYFKKSQDDLSDQWKQFWTKKLIEDYTKEEEENAI